MLIRTIEGFELQALTDGGSADEPAIMITGKGLGQLLRFNTRPLTQLQTATLGAIACMVPLAEMGAAIDAVRRFPGDARAALNHLERQRENFSRAS